MKNKNITGLKEDYEDDRVTNSSVFLNRPDKYYNVYNKRWVHEKIFIGNEEVGVILTLMFNGYEL